MGMMVIRAAGRTTMRNTGVRCLLEEILHTLADVSYSGGGCTCCRLNVDHVEAEGYQRVSCWQRGFVSLLL